MVVFSIAGLGFSLQADEELYAPVIGKYLSAFTSSASTETETEAKVDWRIELDANVEARFGPGGHAEAIYISTETGYHIQVDGGMSAEISNEGRRVDMRVSESYVRGGAKYAWIPLSSLLRVYLSFELPRLGGLVLHGSSLADGHSGRLFLGESGAGKSTVCDLSQDHLIFCDEISIVRQTNDGWHLYPTPFFSREERQNRQLQPLPLAGVYLLNQAQDDRLQALPIAEALPGLLACTLSFGEEREHHDRVLDQAVALLTNVPARRMHFTRSPAFWDRIHQDS